MSGRSMCLWWMRVQGMGIVDMITQPTTIDLAIPTNNGGGMEHDMPVRLQAYRGVRYRAGGGGGVAYEYNFRSIHTVPIILKCLPGGGINSGLT